MTAALIFGATFVVVFALGLQSLNVNGGHRGMAFFTSFAIAVSNLVILKAVPDATDWLQIAAYLCGGPLGILASMHVHPWLARRIGRPVHSHKPIDLGPIGGLGPDAETNATRARLLEQLARDIVHPDAFGHAVSAEVRGAARAALAFGTARSAGPAKEMP